MKKLALLIAFLIVLLPMSASGAVSDWFKSDDCTTYMEDLNRCGGKVVQLGIEVEEAKDATKDAAALGLAGGVFIGAGGAQATAVAIGGAAPIVIPFFAVIWIANQL